MSSTRSGRVPDAFPPPQSARSEESSPPNSWVSNGQSHAAYAHTPGATGLGTGEVNGARPGLLGSW
ncbi:hypothetical protein K438DRAFT_1831045 [Mycena galopus ATCC 62051]|nr:hypothetical protein K438DRAFT_1831045 [Mycena galopus ATCC 62051]